MYQLTSEDGRVNALLRTGKDFVRANLPVVSAQQIIDGGQLVESDKPDYPICVNKQWYFKGEASLEKASPKRKKGEKV